MNSISINIKNTKPQYWRRVLFHISKCNGKINRKFNKDILYGKLEQEDVDLVMALIEKESGKFKFLIFLYRIEIIVIIMILAVLTLFITYFIIFDKAILGLFFLVLDIILIIFYFGFINSCINKVKKSTQRKLYPLIDNINRKLFNMRSLYLMINQDLSYVNIYIIPSFIEANVLLKNILFDSQSSEDRANTQDNKNINYNDKNLIKNKETLETSKNNKTKDILKSNIDIKGLGLL